MFLITVCHVVFYFIMFRQFGKEEDSNGLILTARKSKFLSTGRSVNAQLAWGIWRVQSTEIIEHA